MKKKNSKNLAEYVKEKSPEEVLICRGRYDNITKLKDVSNLVEFCDLFKGEFICEFLGLNQPLPLYFDFDGVNVYIDAAKSAEEAFITRIKETFSQYTVRVFKKCSSRVCKVNPKLYSKYSTHLIIRSYSACGEEILFKNMADLEKFLKLHERLLTGYDKQVYSSKQWLRTLYSTKPKQEGGPRCFDKQPVNGSGIDEDKYYYVNFHNEPYQIYKVINNESTRNALTEREKNMASTELTIQFLKSQFFVLINKLASSYIGFDIESIIIIKSFDKYIQVDYKGTCLNKGVAHKSNGACFKLSKETCSFSCYDRNCDYTHSLALPEETTHAFQAFSTILENRAELANRVTTQVHNNIDPYCPALVEEEHFFSSKLSYTPNEAYMDFAGGELKAYPTRYMVGDFELPTITPLTTVINNFSFTTTINQFTKQERNRKKFKTSLTSANSISDGEALTFLKKYSKGLAFNFYKQGFEEDFIYLTVAPYLYEVFKSDYILVYGEYYKFTLSWGYIKIKKEDIRLHVQNEIQEYKSLLINEIENSDEYIPSADEIASVRRLFNKYKLESSLQPLTKNVQSQIPTIQEEIDITGCIPFSNGIVSLKDGKFRTYSKQDYIFTKLPFDYEEHYDIDKVFDVANSWFRNRDETTYFLQLVGNCIRGSDDRKAYFCIGGGYNGKSFFGQLLKLSFEPLVKTIPGIFFCNNDVDSDKPNPHVCKLSSTWIGVIEETCTTRPIITEVFKKFVGNDSITSRKLNDNEIKDFTVRTRFFFFGNYLPEFTTIDDPLLGRLEVIPFTISQRGVHNDYLLDYGRLKKAFVHLIVEVSLWAPVDKPERFAEFANHYIAMITGGEFDTFFSGVIIEDPNCRLILKDLKEWYARRFARILNEKEKNKLRKALVSYMKRTYNKVESSVKVFKGQKKVSSGYLGFKLCEVGEGSWKSDQGIGIFGFASEENLNSKPALNIKESIPTTTGYQHIAEEELPGITPFIKPKRYTPFKRGFTGKENGENS